MTANSPSRLLDALNRVNGTNVPAPTSRCACGSPLMRSDSIGLGACCCCRGACTQPAQEDDDA